MKQLSHIDQAGKSCMVDIADKSSTRRTATACATVLFPPSVYKQLKESKLESAKGSIIDTANIAGIMAAKKTAELIPMCHPLPVDYCQLSFTQNDDEHRLLITAMVKVTHKTGVEMEALTAVSVAALTVYDMCKALSHDIHINHVHLVNKTGGKSNV